MLKPGIKGYKELIVDEKVTASTYGSGLLDVFATPAMIALIEGAAQESVLSEVEEGFGTVGTRLDVEHLAATPVGMRVWCETKLTEVDRRKLVFCAEVYDECGLIGRGTHERFVIDNAKFMSKAQAKTGQAK